MLKYVMSITDTPEKDVKMTPESPINPASPVRKFDEDIEFVLRGTQGEEKPKSFNVPDRGERVKSAQSAIRVEPSTLTRPDKIVGGKEIPNVVKTLPVPGRRGAPGE